MTSFRSLKRPISTAGKKLQPREAGIDISNYTYYRLGTGHSFSDVDKFAEHNP